MTTKEHTIANTPTARRVGHGMNLMDAAFGSEEETDAAFVSEEEGNPRGTHLIILHVYSINFVRLLDPNWLTEDAGFFTLSTTRRCRFLHPIFINIVRKSGRHLQSLAAACQPLAYDVLGLTFRPKYRKCQCPIVMTRLRNVKTGSIPVRYASYINNACTKGKHGPPRSRLTVHGGTRQPAYQSGLTVV